MLDAKPPDNAVRAAIEKAIVGRTKIALRHWRTDNIFESEALNEVLEAWYSLMNYYEIHEDFAMSIEVVRDYPDLAEHLSFARKNKETPHEYQDELYDALVELDAHLQKIIGAVNQRLYPDGDW